MNLSKNINKNNTLKILLIPVFRISCIYFLDFIFKSGNDYFRKFIPKGKSFNNLTMRDIFAIVKRVNDFPRYNKEFGKLMSPNDFKKIDQAFAN